jgi:amidase
VDVDLCFATASELARRVATKELSPLELVNAYIARIEACDAHYRSYLTPTFERACEQAREAEQAVMAGVPLGPLHGVPVAVKDLYDTKGVRTTCGSTILADHVPKRSAAAVTRLESSGAILLGKLQMTEFAGIAHHPKLLSPRNPYDPRHSPGGSSSGSGVAVAAGLCAAALGSDTVASIRNPAAWNGCVGFKPTFGRVSRQGVFPLAHSLDHVGPLTRSVEDAARVLASIAGHDPQDPTSLRGSPAPSWPRLAPLEPLRVGYDESFVSEATQPAVAECVTEALAALEGAGARVVPVTIPMTDESAPHFNHVFSAEVSAAHRAFYPERAAEYGDEFRGLLEQAQDTGTNDLVWATQFRLAFADAIAELFTRVDLLVTPVGPMNAPPAAATIPWDPRLLGFLRYTYHWNLVGAPAIALPWGLGADGLPRSIQLIGPVGEDERVLSAAAALERPMPRPPTL